MRKMVFILAVILLLIGSCNEKVQEPKEKTIEVSFSVDEVDFITLKSESVPMCKDYGMDYAVFYIDGLGEFITEIYMANGKLVTQPLKIIIGDLPNQSFDVTSFLIYSDMQNDGSFDKIDDEIVRAAPLPGSKYYEFVQSGNPLDVTIVVDAFKKKEVLIDVLCFDDLQYENFGFNWFELSLVKVRSQCWFGDICVDNLAAFEGSWYELQDNGLQIDMPAIMKIEVLKAVEDGNGNYPNNPLYDLLITHINVDEEVDPKWYGDGQCLEVYWPDDEDETEQFVFKLYVLLPVPDGHGGYNMEFVFQKLFAFYDDDAPSTHNQGQSEDDGVVDFVLGGCFDAPLDFDLPDNPPGDGSCTLTQGYWKNHEESWTGSTMPENMFNATQTYLQVLNTPPAGGNAYYILAHQYIAALLNVEVGGVVLANYPNVETAFNNAVELFDGDDIGDINPDDTFSDADKQMYVELATVLDKFNNGLEGPGHCD
jgi:hypothetical protein